MHSQRLAWRVGLSTGTVLGQLPSARQQRPGRCLQLVHQGRHNVECRRLLTWSCAGTASKWEAAASKKMPPSSCRACARALRTSLLTALLRSTCSQSSCISLTCCFSLPIGHCYLAIQEAPGLGYCLMLGSLYGSSDRKYTKVPRTQQSLILVGMAGT